MTDDASDRHSTDRARASTLRVAIIGAGGIGGYYGGRLARAGFDVHLFARGNHGQAIADRGLRVLGPDNENFVIHLPTWNSVGPGREGGFDLVVLSVKSYDTAAAAEIAQRLVSTSGTVLTLQNGVSSYEAIGERVPPDQVMAGATYIDANIVEPGTVIRNSAVQRIVIGEMYDRTGPTLGSPAGQLPELSPRVEMVKSLFESAGLNVETVPDMRRALWDKFLFLANAAGICCLTRLRLDESLAAQSTLQLFRDAVAETAAVGSACGIDLGPDAVDRTLATAARAGSLRPSLLKDLEAGRRLEVDALSGAIVRLGRDHGVATPFHRCVMAALEPHVIRAVGGGS